MTTSCDWWTVYPPAQGDWYDLDTVVADVLARLRLLESDVDEPRIRELVPVAAMQINNYLDRVWPMTAASGIDSTDLDEDLDVTEPLATNVTVTIVDALKRLTVELYGRGRADRNANTFNNVVVGFGDPLDVVLDDLGPHKARWGLA